MTLDTIEAFRDHGIVDWGALQQGLAAARLVLNDLERAGISIKAVTDQITVEGVQMFSKSLRALLDAIAERRSLVKA